MKNATKFAITTLAPVGAANKNAPTSPDKKQTNEMSTVQTVTLKKLLHSRIAESAGNTTSAVISSAPTRFIAITMTKAITTAKIRLYVRALTPEAVVKSSSNVMEKILL